MKTCIKCGGIDFYSNGDCKDCARARAAAYRAKNPEKTIALVAKWRVENPEKVVEGRKEHYKNNRASILKSDAERYMNSPAAVKARTKEWRKANPVQVKEYYAEWVKNNPEKLRIIVQNRRARKLATGGKLSSGLAKKLIVMQKGKCACCGQPLGNDYHLDHIMPLALGGSHTDDNMQLLRKLCNLQKSRTHPVEFMQSRGFLL